MKIYGTFGVLFGALNRVPFLCGIGGTIFLQLLFGRQEAVGIAYPQSCEVM